ncbi:MULTISPECIES: DUF3375 domain-containing protein [Microbacterium]|uniref:DUF3375 domain-containing protein n=1 Tax=Microbacterium maritypicum TaxID=33918 RepID=A0A4Y4B204_MICMQ|nr:MULTISPECIES: DUF3375 domain-containing protein [Microbacterium]KAB1887205.1 DUF3375 domain-containing protein [Microbacterium liquefaciens]KQV04006.1 hypothetical protein ASC55_03300 [Microbacterium sp. Root322]GEC74551.1 hypothetical protein MLI01_06960 [Microbacterium liquefaciens]GGV52444.1 hypothetical protein GCM10010213_08780 [Microbacterium liquefaciens]
MTGTRAEAAFSRAVTAFSTPTLDLLHGRFAPFVVASLSLLFTADRASIPIADAQAELSEILDELRGAGDDEDDRRVPAGTGRDVARNWVRLGWLVQQIDEDIEVYRLSAHAVEALEIAGRTGGGRTRVSNSRVRTLLEAVEHLADSAEADPLRRLARLREERAALDAEIDRIEESGRADPLDDEELYEEAENVLHLARELPADFTRVAESLKLMQRDVVAHLRRDERPTGEVLREYLQRAQDVMNSTPEGRAFAGALRLIGDPDRIDALTEQLHGLLRQPFARMLDATQRAELDAIGRRVELGVEEVLAAQRRASHVITGQVKTHDPLRDRQIDDLLRDVIAALHVWDGTGASAAPVRSLPLIDLGHLRQTVSSIRPPAVPAPLADAEDVEFPDVDTRAWGGPRYAELEEYVSNLGPEFDLATAFEDAADDTRRPVDLVGLLEIAHRNGMTESDAVSVVEALRPDGSTRRFAFGAVTARNPKEEAHA